MKPVLLLLGGLCLAATTVAAQRESLADLARRATEERTAAGSASHLYTNTDLKAAPAPKASPTASPVVTTPAAATTANEKPPADIEPARLTGGSMPAVPQLAASGGDVMLSIALSSTGAVGAVDVLRTTPPYTDALVAAVRTWRFAPALDPKGKPMDTRVLVDALIGAPALSGPTAGVPPKDVAPRDPRVPYPAQTTPPLYPVSAHFAGTVLVETRLDRAGHVVDAKVIRSAPPFDPLALDAARAWTFRPATGADAPPSTYAYLLFVFRHAMFTTGSSAP